MKSINSYIYIIIYLHKKCPDRKEVRDGCEILVYNNKGRISILIFKKKKYNDQIYEKSIENKLFFNILE